MRTTLYTVLVVLTALVPVFAIPGITPDLTARDDDHFHPKPSGVYHKREPHPSPKPGQQYKKRAEQEALTHSDDFSRDLCPLGMTACPITAAPGHTCSAPTSLLEWIREGYECTDVRMDLNSCGGCGSVDLGFDCMTIPGALGVFCLRGECHIGSCEPGFRRSKDGRSCHRVI